MPPLLPDYGIKSGYRVNPAQTLEDLPGDYWTPTRIETAKAFQWDVYRRAAALFQELGLSSVADVGCGTGWKAEHFFGPIAERFILVDQPTIQPIAEATCPSGVFLPRNLEAASLDLPQPVDLIVCADVIEHLSEPDQLLTSIREAVHPEHGIVVFSTPDREIIRGKANMQSPHPAHVREWSSAEFRACLEAYGYVVQSQHLDPPKRIPKLEERLAKRLAGVLPLRRWLGCQTAVCTVATRS